MRKLASLAAVSIGLIVLGACASVDDDDGATSSDALTALTAAQCKTPAVQTTPRTDASGAAIRGSAHTKLNGCILGAQGESGDAVVARVTALLSDTSRLASVKNTTTGGPVFQSFVPGARQGTLATSVTQDIDITLAVSHSPHTRLHTVQSKPAGAPYVLQISNSTPLEAQVIFNITVVKPGNLSVNLQVKAEQNGITVTGASDIVLEQLQDQAASASVLVTDLFQWLQTELAKSAPPARPVTVPPAPAVDAGHAPDSAAHRDSATAPIDAGAPVDAASHD